jgi:purine-binding chemotaxis protein CheW
MAEQIKNGRDQYLLFELDQQTYGINIRAIKEVLEFRPVTSLPRSERHLRGVINLRGQVLPVLDLKLVFGLEETQTSIDTCILILEIKDENGDWMLVGALADSVREVIDLNLSDIEAPPKVGTNVDTAFIYGVAQYEKDFVILLEAHKLTGNEDLAELGLQVETLETEALLDAN